MERTRKIERKPNHRKGASVLSVMTFAFTIPTFRKGFKKDLQEEDITEHLEAHDSKRLGDRLEESWKQELILHRHPSLWRAIGRVFGLEFFLLGLFLMFLELIKISQPVALSQLIKYYTQAEEEVITENEAYMYAGVIVGASFLNVVGGHTYMLNLQHLGMKLRVACCSVVYRKSLRLSKSVLGGTTIGQMVNLLSNDVNRCDTAVLHSHNLWICPLETILIVIILFSFVGLTSTVGVLFMAMFVPLQMYLGKKTSIFRLKTALKTDERVRLMNEIISGIQVIKMYTWEKPFTKLVAMARRLEISHIRATSYIRGTIISFAIFTARFAIFLTILVYVLLGYPLTAEYVFVVSSFYNILRQAMTVHFPQGVTQVAEFNISISRIQQFLSYDEIKLNEKNSHYSLSIRSKIEKNGIPVDVTELEKAIENVNTNESDKKTKKPQYSLSINSKIAKNGIPVAVSEVEKTMENVNTNVVVELKNASAKWSSNSADNTLHEINLQAQSGQLVAVIGPVGSGKTSLLHAILQELPLKGGTLIVDGKISYASQEPWVFAGTVQQNILFGQPMDSERYQEVIRVCALVQDFLLLPYGDETIVGERGVTLSGGQRARVSLARAVYKDADIYLLDDPLSAVDTHVGKQLFEECISKFLKNKSTILVTHQLQYLRNINRIYLLDEGKIIISGTYHDLKESQLDFTKQFAENNEETSYDIVTTKEIVKKDTVTKGGSPTQVKEQMGTGSISGDVYTSYFKAAGSLLTGLGVMILFILTQLSASSADYFLTYWVNMEQKNANTPESSITDLARETCIYIYSGIIVAMVVITLLRSYSFFKYCMKASTTLHNNMFSNIVQAPMRFFNTNSSGRVLNRFSKDMGTIDEVLPMVAIDCVQVGLTVIGVTVVVSLVNPWLLIVTAIILAIFYTLRVIYMKTSRSVKRLEGITRSPVFAHLNASLQGLTTIRAFGAETILQKEFDDHQDLHSSVWYTFLSCSRAFGFWLDLICVGYIAIVTFSFFLIKTEKYGGNVGLAITQAISLTGLFQWGMRQWTELENQMTSVERVVEYTKIDHEFNPREKVPPPTWPAEGNVNFLSVSLKYSPTDPYVLKQLNFSIIAKEKIGIVGRTGAGKSSLISALFQLTKTEGVILIDNFDITKIPLHNLRSKISIIPQEPVLFSGTLRKNLDPFDEYPDADLWKALEEVELKHVVADLSAGLNDQMSEGGSNFSVGQRQLVCLARAIIRKNNILVLDEATANVDPQTDSLIQNTIRTKFAECTVLTIAHRLHTIMDSDKVLVMDAGSVAEFDHPHFLMRNENGLFYGMVQQTGHAMAESLSKIAEDSYKDKIIGKMKN